MKLMLTSLCVFMLVNISSANIGPDKPLTNKDIRERAHIVNTITDKMSVTEAQLLRDTLEGLSLDDLADIKNNPEAYDSIFWNLENRSPDDEDEHGSNY